METSTIRRKWVARPVPMQTRRWMVEPLEERRLLAVIHGSTYNPPNPGNEVGFIAPPQSGFSPIAIPAGITPPGATQLEPPPGGELPGFTPILYPAGVVPPGATTLSTPPGELPPGMTDFSGAAESTASTQAVGFLRQHNNATGDVAEGVYQNAYVIPIEVHDGANFFRYGVSEAADQIGASYVVRDGAHSEILALRELSTSPLISTSDPSARNGGWVYALFDNNILTAMAVNSEIAGVSTSWTYPEGAGSGADDPGLTFPGGYAALDALVTAHLTGPAAQAALDTFHFAADEYFELAGVGPVLADFNHDQHIDAADFVDWRKNNRTAADYSLWRSHFGEAIAAGGATVGGGVPEPGSIALAALAAGGFALLARTADDRTARRPVNGPRAGMVGRVTPS